MKTKIGIILPLFIIVQLNWLFSQTTQPSAFYDNFLKNGWIFFTSFVVLGGFIALLNLLKVILKMQQIQIYKEIGKEPLRKQKRNPFQPFLIDGIKTGPEWFRRKKSMKSCSTTNMTASGNWIIVYLPGG